MAKNDKPPEKSNSERLDDGELLCRIIIEMLGAPKEHIENTMKEYVAQLSVDTKFTVVSTHIPEAVLQEENPKADPSEKKQLSKLTQKKLFSIYAEIEMWFSNVDSLVEFCFDSLPSSIEIIEPEEMILTSSHFAGLLNDLQSKLHRVDMELKLKNADMQAISTSVRTMVINFIMYCLQDGAKTSEFIAEKIGMKNDRISYFLTELTEKKIILKKDDTYCLP